MGGTGGTGPRGAPRVGVGGAVIRVTLSCEEQPADQHHPDRLRVRVQPHLGEVAASFAEHLERPLEALCQKLRECSPGVNDRPDPADPRVTIFTMPLGVLGEVLATLQNDLGSFDYTL